MDARILRALRPWAAIAATLVGWLMTFSGAHAGAYRTKNFAVSAPSAELAKEIGDSAEVWRRKLAIEWLGKELPDWSAPCPITATVAPHLGAGGATSFVFDQGQVFDWRMNIQGSRERVLDSVLPHEITHTIFASHFRQPLPRWADEGACTTVEHVSEISKQERMLLDFLRVSPGHPGRGIPFDAMFVMQEYPRDVLPLYAQGHSLAVFLIGQKGKREFLSYLADGMQHRDWRKATRDHYGYDHLLALQNSWLDWVKAGRPAITPPADATLLAGETSVAVPRVTPLNLRGRAPTSAKPSSNDTAALLPVPGPADDAYGDWTTRPVRHTMNVAPGGTTTAADGASVR